MEILRYILIVVEVLCCLMLIGVILLQQSKSQGMGLAFGGGMGESLFGSRAGNVLTKLTVILSLIFLANTTILGILYTTRADVSLVESAPAAPTAPIGAQAPAPVGDGGMLTAPPAQQQAPLLTTDGSAPLLTPDVAPVEAAPVEVAPVDSAPVELAPVEMAPVEVAPVVDAPVAEGTVESVPVEAPATP